MADLDLAAIEARHAATTQGEWQSTPRSAPDGQQGRGAILIATPLTDNDPHGPTYRRVARFERSNDVSAVECVANAAFCASAHQDVPLLVARIRELEAILGDVLQDSGIGPDAMREAYRMGQRDMQERAAIMLFRDRQPNESAHVRTLEVRDP